MDDAEALIDLATELNGRYAGLNVPLLKQNETLKEAAEAFELVGKEVLTEEEYQKLDEYINLCTVAWSAMAKCINHLAAKDKEAKE